MRSLYMHTLYKPLWLSFSWSMVSSNRYWRSINPRLIYEVPLHDIKVGMLCTTNAKQIIGPIFYTEPINFDEHVKLI
jgi:hypothetical protein